jgi:hypothetical protein
MSEAKGKIGGKSSIVEGAGYDPDLEQLLGNDTGYKPWTPEEEAMLTRYYAKPGITVAKLMDKMGRSSASIQNKAKSMGLARTKTR